METQTTNASLVDNTKKESKFSGYEPLRNFVRNNGNSLTVVQGVESGNRMLKIGKVFVTIQRELQPDIINTIKNSSDLLVVGQAIAKDEYGNTTYCLFKQKGVEVIESIDMDW